MHIPDRTEWNQLSAKQQEKIARKLGGQLPSGFTFRDVREFSMGDVTQRVAQFWGHAKSTFSFVPGGEVTLGFDATQWEPNNEEQESWQDTADEYGIEVSIVEQVDAATTATRSVLIAPFLIETAADEVGWESASFDDPDVQQLLGYLPRDKVPHSASIIRDDRHTRVSRADSGKLSAETATKPTHESLSVLLQNEGMRFPTSDEWEYACGAGSPALFRWGDHAPCDCYPVDVSPSGWNQHRQPNAFGLHIAEDPYKYELVAEPNTTRGGDGGGMICGGAGFFIGWLTLATAYFEPFACNIDPEYGISVGYTIGRRVLPLT